ncbi:MAG TPA: ABC transporter substrate-binding protein [Aliidongia sp.]|uniref:ABC transporter substrate-binding protein n=1 Tax=Aliidongia sp. TaxID=1914230 RepID=UPI002DDD4833|nr:ABC transporter substrate-binding protein [Aliidongia sp.]HEV2678430.1 ABC transporter substrate-binding protein [Aliidongia sp.]
MRLFSILLLSGLWVVQASASGFPVTIDNCGVPETFDRAPVRAVSNDVNITDTLLALDLQDHMAGFSGVSGWNKIAPDLQGRLGGVPELSQKYPSLEVLLGARTDFYFAGWSYGMRVGGDVTPDTLADHGIKSYAIRESCVHLGPRPAARLDDMYQDLIAIGRIFGVEERAHALAAGFAERIGAVAARLKDAAPARVFVYDSGEDAPETAGGNAMPTALIAAAGGRNVMDDVPNSWTRVSWEAVVARDPAFILIVDYDVTTPEQKIAFLKGNPALTGIDAVRHDRFVVIPYDAATPGVRNIGAVESLARAFHPDRFP